MPNPFVRGAIDAAAFDWLSESLLRGAPKKINFNEKHIFHDYSLFTKLVPKSSVQMS